MIPSHQQKRKMHGTLIHKSTNPPMYTDPKPWDENEDGVGVQTDPEDAAVRNQQWHPQNWEAIMEEAEGLAYDDPWSDSDTTVMELDGSKGPALSLHDEAANSLSHHCQACSLTYARVTHGPYAATGGGNHQQRCHRGACR